MTKSFPTTLPAYRALRLLRVRLFLPLLLATISSIRADAQVTYEYTGDAFTYESLNAGGESPVNPDWGTNVTAEFTFDVPDGFTGQLLASDVLGWSVSCGAFTITPASVDNQLNFGPLDMVNGQVTDWNFAAYANEYSEDFAQQILSYYPPTGTDSPHDASTIGEDPAGANVVFAQYNTQGTLVVPQGTWNEVAVPEPSSAVFAGIGIPLLAFFARRKRAWCFS